MLTFCIISIIVCVTFVLITIKMMNRVGNILNVLGIIWANVGFWYSVGSFRVEPKATTLLSAVVHMMVALLFCNLLDYVTRENENYLSAKGVFIESKVCKKNGGGSFGNFFGRGWST